MLGLSGAVAYRTPQASIERNCFGTKSLLSRLGKNTFRSFSHTSKAVYNYVKNPEEPSTITASHEKANASISRLCVAPMMDWTDIHYRHLARLLTRHTRLYTEMVVDKTLIYQSENLSRWLEYTEVQHPVALQLGGSDPASLAKATSLALPFQYDEINLNCGCPSERVAGAGCFGASLMAEADLVAQCTAAIKDKAPDTAVTVKCRIGVDDTETYDQLCDFIATVSDKGGVSHFIIHARKAILGGLSPDQNRKVPPLHREWVYALARDFPHLQFTINGQVTDAAHAHSFIHPTFMGDGSDEKAGNGGAGLRGVDGVMIGRAAYERPWSCLAAADQVLYAADMGSESEPPLTRRRVLREYAEYAHWAYGRHGVTGRRKVLKPDVRQLMIPLLNLFHGEPGGKRWKREVDVVLSKKPSSVEEVLDKTLGNLSDEILDAEPIVVSSSDLVSQAIDLSTLPRRGYDHRASDPPVESRTVASVVNN